MEATEVLFTATPVPPTRRFELANGLKLVVFPSSSSPHVSIRLVIAAGGGHDSTELAGCASMAANLTRYGAGERGEEELSDTLDFLGARLAISTGHRFSELTADITTIESGHFEQVMALIADMVLRPHFEGAELEKVRKRRLAGLKQLAENHSALCRRTFAMATFGEHPFGRSNSGTAPTIRRLDIDQIRRHHALRWRPEDSVLGIAGDVDAESTRALVEQCFAGWERGNAERIQTPPAARHPETRISLLNRQDPSLSQVHFRVGHPVEMSLKASDYFPYRLAVQILGGDFTARLNQRLRVREGLTYGARYDCQVSGLTPGIAAAASYAPVRDAARAVEITLEELQRFRDEPIIEKEIEEFKRKIINAFPFRFETPSATLERHLWTITEELDESFLENYQESINQVTADELREAIRAHIDATGLDIALVANDDLIPKLEGLVTESDALSVLDLASLQLS